MEILRVGIVGSSFGVHAYLPALQQHPAFEVVALASPNTAATVAPKHKIAKAFASCEAMLEGCELDVVAVVSPPFAHCDNVLASLRAGKHVICEEPFGLSVDEAQSMVDAARAAGTVCGVGCDLRFVPASKALKQYVADGNCDPLRGIEITALRQNLRRTEERPRGWFFERESGGGVAGTVLSHLIDYANWLAARPPVRSFGFRRTANPTRVDRSGEFVSTVDDGAFVLVDYGDGLVARLTADGTAEMEMYTCAVHGEERGALASGTNIAELGLYSIDKGQTEEREYPLSKYERYAFNSNIPTLMEILDEFVKAILGESNELPTFEDALITQRVLASIGYVNDAAGA
ncbi:MAG: Gfo/Idh/MocA family oxidoreductase [Candidatus Eremiobacteraeota bacterium]|nr:Gfo/Idh/MocA family oxidoreductase [Candidatus Eremiobacteraeota bacterium]